jgi:hypothetical protein
MKTRILNLSAGLSLALFVLGPVGHSQDPTETKPAESEQGVFDQLAQIEAVAEEVAEATTELKKGEITTQLQGPLHDAFAEAVVTNPTPGPIVNREPPKELDEMPPADKPEGEDIQWYGGYWEFDQDREDFTWVSGIYRKPPPARQWMAGHWVKVEAGWQRQRGVWMVLDLPSLEFVPTAPPEAPVEVAAETAPNDNSVFVPGHFEYKQSQYTWNPGKWIPNYPNWVWIPAHWVWTPCGYVFVPGYWDYLIEARGMLYAPVTVDPAHLKPGFTFTPSFVVHTTCLLEALFVRPGCGYFFGSYFKNKHYTPWPDHCVHGKICDPLFTHYKHHHKHKNNWEGGLRKLYHDRQSGKAVSPPSNLKEFGKFVKDFKNKSIGKDDVRRNLLVGSAKKINTNFVRMQRLDKDGLQAQRRGSDQLRNAAKDMASKQSEHLRSNRGGGSGGSNKVLKFDVDKSVSNRFRNLNNGRFNNNNNNNNNNKNGGGAGGGNNGGQRQGNGIGNRIGNNGQNGNGQNNNGQGGLNRNGQNNNGQNNSNKNGNGPNNGQNSNGLGGLNRIGNGQNNNGQNNGGQNNANKNGNGAGNNGSSRIGNGLGNGIGNRIGNGNSNGGGQNNANKNSGNGGATSRFNQGSGGGNSTRSFQNNGGFGSGSGSGSSGGSSSRFGSGSGNGSSSSRFGSGSGSGGSSFRSFGGGSGGNSSRSFGGGSGGGGSGGGRSGGGGGGGGRRGR